MTRPVPSGGDGGSGLAGSLPRQADGFAFRPHPLFIILRSGPALAWLVVGGFVAWVGAWTWRWAGLGPAPGAGAIAGVVTVLMLARLAWAVAQWAVRSYGLTGGVFWTERGVLHRRRDELPLGRVQSIALDRPLIQRLLGLGTIGFASAGTGGYEVVWLMIARPRDRMREARGAMGLLERAA